MHKTKTTRLRLTLAVILSTMLPLHAARADGGTDHDKAVAAFDEARKLIDEGNCDAAVPKLEQSLRYEPSVGTRLSIADCTESHNPLEAWTQLREAQRLAYLKHDERTKVAQDRATALEARLPVVHVVIPALVLQEPGLEVRVDGVIIDRFFYESGMLAMTAGPHVVEVTTPNRKWSQQVVAQAGATTAVNVHLETTCATPPPVRQGAQTITHERGGGQRAVGLVLSGVGLGALAAGGVLGGAALVKKGDIDSACGGSATTCSAKPGALDGARADQQNYAHLSTLAFIVGGVAVAGGVVLYLTAPHARVPVTVTAAFDSRSAGLQVLGRF